MTLSSSFIHLGGPSGTKDVNTDLKTGTTPAPERWTNISWCHSGKKIKKEKEKREKEDRENI
jgi:hypothetical protein